MAENMHHAITHEMPDSTKYEERYTTLCVKLLELDEEVAREIGDGGYLVQNLGQAFLEEPLVGLGLDLYQIGQLQIEAGAGEGLTYVLAESLIFQIDHE